MNAYKPLFHNKATLYMKDDLWSYSRVEVSDLTWRFQKYAQYPSAVKMEYKVRGKRKRQVNLITTVPVVVLEGWNHPNPPPKWDSPKTGSTRYKSCDPQWENEFNAFLNEYLSASKAIVVMDFRKHNPNLNEPTPVENGDSSAAHVGSVEHLVPTRLENGFGNYIDKLKLTPKSRSNYRQYVRWIEKFGVGALNLATMRTEVDVANFVKRLADRYDEVHMEKLPFDKRRGDAKTLINHYLKFLQGNQVAQAQDKLDEAGEFDILNQQDGKEKVLRSIALRRGQRQFRDNLLRAYNGSCAVTGTSIEDVLEAAHIVPYNGNSTNHICNGLLLRSDIHALFDLGLLSINPTTLSVYCSEQIRQDPMYRESDGKRLRVPPNAKEHPDIEALQRHFDKRMP